MAESIEASKKRAQRDEERFQKAEASLKKMLEEIAPFIKKHEVRRYSSAGKWYEASSCPTSRPSCPISRHASR